MNSSAFDESTEGLKFYRSQFIFGAIILFTVPLALLFIWILVDNFSLAPFIFTLALLAVAGWSVRILFDGRPKIIFNISGIGFTNWACKFIPWDDIEEIGASPNRVGPIFTIILKQPVKYRGKLSRLSNKGGIGQIGNASSPIQIPFFAFSPSIDKALHYSITFRHIKPDIDAAKKINDEIAIDMIENAFHIIIGLSENIKKITLLEHLSEVEKTVINIEAYQQVHPKAQDVFIFTRLNCYVLILRILLLISQNGTIEAGAKQYFDKVDRWFQQATELAEITEVTENKADLIELHKVLKERIPTLQVAI